jgi:cysteinyl-tRNA synthetase
MFWGLGFYTLRAGGRGAAGEFDPAGDELLATVQKLRASFLEKMDDDFNTGGAIADLFDLVRELNKYADQQRLDESSPLTSHHSPLTRIFVRATRVLRELSNILGLFRSLPAQRGGGGEGVVPKLMQLLIDLRAEARAKKDFATGDRIRNGLAEIGITLEDRKGGATEWRIG